MNRIVTTLPCLLLVTLAMSGKTSVRERTDSLLDVLDHAMENREYYIGIKENRIDSLMNEKDRTTEFSRERYAVNARLADEYRLYIADSSLHYLDRNIRIARILGDRDKENTCRLHQAEVFTKAGMFLESHLTLASMKPETLSDGLLAEWYHQCAVLYREAGKMGAYDTPVAETLRNTAIAYRDSLLRFMPEDSEIRLNFMEKEAVREKDFDKALYLNERRLAKVEKGSLDWARIQYHRYAIFRDFNRAEEGLENLIEAAITDFRLCTQEQASFIPLSDHMKKTGQLHRARNYSDYAISTIVRYGNRIRSYTGAQRTLELQREYSNLLNSQNNSLKFIIMAITLLALVTVGISLMLIQQSRARKKAYTELKKSNMIAHTYIAKFFLMYSSYVARLMEFRAKVHTYARKKDYDKILEATDPDYRMTTEELQNLYNTFDSAFLEIFPDFVSEFNGLLLPDRRLHLKPNEILNTELRIFALVRLGITDSQMIAQYLHYSVRTVYNYRSSIKNKLAVPKEKFESMLMKIG